MLRNTIACIVSTVKDWGSSTFFSGKRVSNSPWNIHHTGSQKKSLKSKIPMLRCIGSGGQKQQ